MADLPITIIAFVIVIGLLVFIHEGGHFLMAKLFKVRVETFSLGFGPRLFGFKKGGTDYRVSAFPLGGYVKMLGENPDEMEQTRDMADALTSKPKWQRLIIFVGGPVANILLAIVLPAALYMVSFTMPAHLKQPARIGFVALNSPAEKAGIQAGDLMVEFAGIQNPTWSDVEQQTTVKPGQSIPVVIERQGQPIATTMRLETHILSDEPIGASGLVPEFPTDYTKILEVTPNLPAAKVGIRPGDEIVAINDLPVKHSAEFYTMVGLNAGRQLKFTIRRQGQTLQVSATPETHGASKRGLIGVIPKPSTIPMIDGRLGVVEAFQESVNQNIRILQLTGQVFAQVFQGERTVKDTFAGPLRIAAMSGEAAQQGVEPLLKIMALLSLSLGVFNLLPIPVLDGGLVFMLFLESCLGWVGRELTASLREKIQFVGLAFLVLLMGYIIYADIAKLIQ